MMLVATVIAVSTILASNQCEGVVKRWDMNWDLDDPDNWKGRDLPCGGRAASLPRRPTIPVFLGDRLTTASLDLPVEGELIFGNGANLVLDDSQQEECQDATWIHHGHDSWWDPDAWHYPKFDDAARSPVPHVHRVPCIRDGVSFSNPNLSMYSVHLSPPPITVSSFTIGNQDYTTSDLAAYARTQEGLFRFVGVSSQSDAALLYVDRPEECSDITGCLCGTEDALEKICHIMKPKCPTPECDSPIKMKGFCCEVCGAEVVITHNGSLPLRDVENLLEDHIRTPVAEHLTTYISKMDDDFFHVYFTPVNDQGNYITASLAFKTKFDIEFSAAGQHTTLLAFSGNQIPEGRKGPSAHSVAAAFITLSVCLAIGIAVYYLRKRRITTQLSFMFRRLESSSRRVSVVSDVGGRRLSTASSIFMPSYNREGGLRFLNPIFNQSMASLVGAGVSDGQPPPTAVPDDQLEGEHENPMYKAYENMSQEEKQASEDTLRAQGINISGPVLSSDSSPSEQNLILHGSQRPDLDIIEEEKFINDETGDTSPEDSHTENLNNLYTNDVKNYPDKDSTHDSSAEVDNPEASATDQKQEPDTNAVFFLDIDSPSSCGTDKDPPAMLEGDFFNALELNEDDQKNLNDGSRQEDAPEKANESDIVSTSSSDDNIDASMNIEGFVPLKDFGPQN
ncbi:uncharacterized protein LOC135222790 isoform X1 [Macrobrachium nipponense]|uniref:uncharacterized protein LOC135222790 isoform X1 n=2 Tax=Macrobrachium nipponense TaxID=159736 RepID=UPI0030C84FAB